MALVIKPQKNNAYRLFAGVIEIYQYEIHEVESDLSTAAKA